MNSVLGILNSFSYSLADYKYSMIKQINCYKQIKICFYLMESFLFRKTLHVLVVCIRILFIEQISAQYGNILKVSLKDIFLKYNNFI